MYIITNCPKSIRRKKSSPHEVYVIRGIDDANPCITLRFIRVRICVNKHSDEMQCLELLGRLLRLAGRLD